MSNRIVFLLFAALVLGCKFGPAAGASNATIEYPIELVRNSGGTTSERMVISADGRFELIASGNVVQMWDAAKRRLLRRFSGLPTLSKAVAISRDATQVAAAGDDTILVWETGTGKIKQKFASGVGNVNAISFSGDGARLIYGGNGVFDIKRPTPHIITREIQSGRIVASYGPPTIGTDFVHAINTSSDGQVVAVGTYKGSIRILDDRGGSIRTFDAQVGKLWSLELSADGKVLAVGGDAGARVLEIASGKVLLSVTANVWSLSLSKDKSLLALGYFEPKKIEIWDVQTGKLLRTSNELQPNAIQFSQDGKSLLADGKHLDVTTLKSTSELGSVAGGNVIRHSPTDRDELLVAAGSIRASFRINLRDGSVSRIFDGSMEAVDWNPEVSSSDGGRFVGSDDSRSLYEKSIGHPSRKLSGLNGPIYVFDVSSDGSLVAGGNQQGIQLFDVANNQLKRVVDLGAKGSTPRFAFSPDARKLAIYDGNYGLMIFDTVTGVQSKRVKLLEGGAKSSSTYGVSDVLFFPDGKSFLTLPETPYSNAVEVWSVEGPRLIKRISVLDKDGLTSSASLSSNGNLALIGGFDGLVRALDLRSGQVKQTYRGLTSPPISETFALEGRRVIAADYDGISIWSSDSGELLGTCLISKDGDWIVITPEGFFNASSGGSKLINLVSGLEVSSIDQVYNALYRPDLVREKLAGDPNGKVKAAAAQLDLEKVMASGVAPKVAITAPATGTSSAVDEIEVLASITDQGGGIGKVEWRVNGVTLGIETRGLDRIDSGSGAGSASGAMQMKRKLALERGDNRIEVLAYNAKGLIASEAAQITIKWDGEKTATPPKLYVLAVGVNDYYDSRLRLAYAVPDATALAEGFKKAGSGLYASVEVTKVLDADVTLANMDKVFSELGGKVQPRDVFVFFLAGHGKTKNGRYYFLPRDFRYEDESSIEKAGMDQDRFQAWFARIGARKSILLYDTCESGSLTGNTRGSDIDERLGALNRMARATGRTFLTATTDDAPALEGYHGHGVFTYALLDALDHADVNKNGLIEVSELADYIDQKVPDFSFEAFKLRQIPQRSIVGNNFALTNKAEVLAVSTDGAATIPAGPTHVILSPVDVKNTTSSTGLTVVHLGPGTQVRLMESMDGWVLIAREGRKLGYVQSNSLIGLQ